MNGEVRELQAEIGDLRELLMIKESECDDAMGLVDELTNALREAILITTRVERVPSESKNIFAPPSYGWTSWTQRMADLCGLDLSEIDPNRYGELKGKQDGNRKHRTVFHRDRGIGSGAKNQNRRS